MKLDTSKYKLTIYSETTCPACVELNSSLEEQSIPFEKKDITRGTTTRGPSIDNRWEFIDITNEVGKEGEAMLVPLIVVETVNGDTKYHSANYDFDEVQEFMEILKQYCI